MARLTAAKVKALKKGEASDDSPRGLCIRVVRGRKLWAYRYRKDGRRRRVGLGAFPEVSLAAARRLASDLALRVASGDDPGAEKELRTVEPTVADVLDRALREHWEPRRKPRTVQSVRRNLELHVRPKLGKLKVSDLTRKRVAVWFQALGKETPGAANRTLAYLSKAMSLAVLWELAPTNPCKGIERFPEKKVERYLSDTELRKLREVTDELAEEGFYPPALALPWVLIMTGMRTGEALGMRWRDIDWESGTLHLPDSKTGERTIPMSAEVLAMVDQLERRSEWVFPKQKDTSKPIRSPWSWWFQIRARAGLNDVRLHDCRHSHASMLVRAGVHISVVSRMLGHSNINTTMRYIHTDRAQEQDALRRLASVLPGGGPTSSGSESD